MTDVTQYFSNESKYLSASDLPQQGMVRVIIDSLEEVDFGKNGAHDIKPVINFQGHKKGLSLNKTNGMAIAQVLGNNMEAWIGKEILIYATTTDFAGDTVPCIRVNMPREEVGFNQQNFQQPTQQPQNLMKQQQQPSTSQQSPNRNHMANYDEFDNQDVPY